MHRKRTKLLAGALLVLAATALAGDLVLRVQMDSAAVRSKASFLAPIIDRLATGAPVTVLHKGEGWSKVRLADGRLGWMRTDSLSKRVVALRAGSAGAGATTDQEMALAGKGFNASVEAEHQRRNHRLAYRWVDQMEGYGTTWKERDAFRRAGGLKTE